MPQIFYISKMRNSAKKYVLQYALDLAIYVWIEF